MSSLINENIVKGKWKEIKGDLQKAWSRLTDDEIESAKADLTRFTGTVQRKYGLGQEEIRGKLNEVFKKYGADSEEDMTNEGSPQH